MEIRKQVSEISDNCGTNNANSTPYASGDAANQAGAFLYFPKRPLAFEDQLQHLVAKGLAVNDSSFALACLADSNYYRLRGYWLTLEGTDGRFLNGVSFDDIWAIYELDGELRQWLLKAIIPIEVKMRSQFAYHFAHASGPLGYLDPSNYRDEAKFNRSMESFARERKQAYRHNVPCVVHNMDAYGVLPVWAAVEIMSLGTLSQLFGNLNGEACASEEDAGFVSRAIARAFGAKPLPLKSWFHCLTYVRNLAAHAARFYNLVMPLQPRLLGNDRRYRSNKEFPTLLVLKNIYERSWPARWVSLGRELVSIIDAHPDVSLAPMGFPQGWRNVLGVA